MNARLVLTVELLIIREVSYHPSFEAMHWFSLSVSSLYIFRIYLRLKYLSLILDLHTFSAVCFTSSLKSFPSCFCFGKEKEKKKEKKKKRTINYTFPGTFSSRFPYLAFIVDILLTYLPPSAVTSQPHVHLPSHPFRVSVLCFWGLPIQRVEPTTEHLQLSRCRLINRQQRNSSMS